MYFLQGAGNRNCCATMSLAPAFLDKFPVSEGACAHHPPSGMSKLGFDAAKEELVAINDLIFQGQRNPE